MKLTEIAAQKAGSQSGVAALLTFFSEMEQDSDALSMFIDQMAAAGGGVTTYGVPVLTFSIKPDQIGYTVRVRLETEDVSSLVLDTRLPDGSYVGHDSPVETYVIFHLFAQAAIEVALADEDKLHETMERLLALSGGYLHRVEKTFGDTQPYRDQVADAVYTASATRSID